MCDKNPHDAPRKNTSSKVKYVTDHQTGRVYKLRDESFNSRVLARVSIIYLLLVLVFLFWLAFDTWVGAFSLARMLGYSDVFIKRLGSSVFLLFAYAFLGGALGGTVNGLRSTICWHAELKAFGGRFIWKHLAAPWIGAALALFVVALIQGGIGLFGGDLSLSDLNLERKLVTFGVGVLAGYGSQKVFVWLDGRVNQLLVVRLRKVIVPVLIDKSLAETESILEASELTVGEVKGAADTSDKEAWKVVSQLPPAGSEVARGGAVTITVKAIPVESEREVENQG